MTPGGAVLQDGARTALDLRSKYGTADAKLTDIDRYLDLGLRERARALADH